VKIFASSSLIALSFFLLHQREKNLPFLLNSAYCRSVLELHSASHPCPIANGPEETNDDDKRRTTNPTTNNVQHQGVDKQYYLASKWLDNNEHQKPQNESDDDGR